MGQHHTLVQMRRPRPKEANVTQSHTTGPSEPGFPPAPPLSPNPEHLLPCDGPLQRAECWPPKDTSTSAS